MQPGARRKVFRTQDAMRRKLLDLCTLLASRFQHRGSRFYVAADEQATQSTSGLLNLLFSLQSAPGQGKSPLLTPLVR